MFTPRKKKNPLYHKPNYTTVTSNAKAGDSTEIILPGYEHIPLRYNPNCPYLHNYHKLAIKLNNPKIRKDDWYRALIKEDLFFILYFHLQLKKANHPFVVTRCNEVQEEKNLDVVDLWARDHFKSSILTTALPIQRILRNPEERICIFSFKRENALKFYLPIKTLFEKDSILHRLFPKILSPNVNDYELWTRDIGLSVLRQGFYREPTLMWSALSEGMPTGMHFTGRIYDDIMTVEMAASPAEMQKSKDAFDMSQNLVDSETHTTWSRAGGELRNDREDIFREGKQWQVIAGTPYHFNDIFKHLAELKNHDGSPAYRFRRYPATDTGKADGKPVLLSQAELDRRKRNKSAFASQQLLTPVEEGEGRLQSGYLVKVNKDKLPKDLYKFLLIDPAGDQDSMKHKGKGNKWAIALLGVEPFRDDTGASSIYILDLFLKQASLSEVIRTVKTMYLLAGRIVKLAIEKVATSTYEIHIANALKEHNVFLSVDNGRLVLLRPGMRNKQERIMGALEWPLQNGKWHYLDSIKEDVIKVLKEEMNQFPLGGDDGIDILSYIYDLIKDYKFPKKEAHSDLVFTKKKDLWLYGDDGTSSSRYAGRNVRAWMVN